MVCVTMEVTYLDACYISGRLLHIWRMPFSQIHFIERMVQYTTRQHSFRQGLGVVLATCHNQSQWRYSSMAYMYHRASNEAHRLIIVNVAVNEKFGNAMDGIYLTVWLQNSCGTIHVSISKNMFLEQHQRALHPNDVTWAPWRQETPASRLYVQWLVRSSNKERIKGPHPSIYARVTKSNAGDASMPWCHHNTAPIATILSTNPADTLHRDLRHVAVLGKISVAPFANIV